MATHARTRNPFLCYLRYGSLALFFVLSSTQATLAQSGVDATTPPGQAPGAPSGSYPLSGFENVNLFNGHLNFHLPLMKLAGRGDAGFSPTLNIEYRWVVQHDSFSGSHFPGVNFWGGLHPGYGPGVLQGRQNSEGCSEGFYYAEGTTRLTFTASDGTEYELRDQIYGGTGASSFCDPYNPGAPGASRGTVFVTADGTAATFTSDTTIYDRTYTPSGPYLLLPSGFLMLRDGTRYRIDNGMVTWLRDRNGNKVTFTNAGSYTDQYITSATDSLNRQVTFEYDIWEPPYGTCDRIRFKGFGGVERIVRVTKTMLSNALIDGDSLATYADLFPGLQGSSSTYHDVGVVSKVWLPDQRSYQFRYNRYGELSRVDLPMGGRFEYSWTAFPQGLGALPEINRRVTERRAYTETGALAGRSSYGSYQSSNGVQGTVQADHFDFNGSLLSRDMHYFHGHPFTYTTTAAFALPNPIEGREYQTEFFASDGWTILRRVANTWTTCATLASTSINPCVTQSITTIEPAAANLVTKQTFSYDNYNNQTDIYEYGFGNGSPGSFVRRSHTDYLTTNPVNGVNYATNTSIHLRSLPTQQSVYDAGGTEKARTSYQYDNYAGGGNNAALTDRYLISGLDAAFTTGYQTRGNPTRTTRWILATGAELHTYAQFDIAGNVLKVIDPRNYATTFDFDDRFGTPDGNAQLNYGAPPLGSSSSFAFASKITNAANHISFTQFDYYTGQAVDAEDINGVVSSFYFNDLLDRPTQVIRAAGTSSANRSEFIYDDVNRTTTVKNDKTNLYDGVLKSQTVFDGIGRTIEARQYETQFTFIATKTNYDALGRAYQTSNPYRGGETVVWTTTSFDALGRVVSVTTPDNAAVVTSYSGNTVTVTDPAGKTRKSVTDAMGRLIEIYEDPNTLNYLTSYSYDVLDNLTAVSQGVQTRTFVYDSLKRLTSATNPESGTATYGYDNNGNLTTKLDARNITTTFASDALNRLTSKSYNDNPQTPTVSYFYDAQSLPAGAPSFDRGSATGRLVGVAYGSGSSAGTYRGYDQLGRVVRQHQRTDSVNYLVEATYNRASGMTSQTYPSVPGAGDRRMVTYTPDDAGRLAALSSSATSYAPGASVSSIGYAPHNGLKTETYGNNLIHAVSYNNRLQSTEIKLGTSGAPTSVVSLTNNYGTTNNNGNLQTTSYVGDGLSYTQTFGYDQLNRLTTSQEGASWSQTNSYDRYGNRSIVGGALTFSASTNRITNAGYSYDVVGNLTNDTAHSYTFDAENKISKVDNVSAYVYDGEGQRVRKLVNENLRFIYGIGGQQIAEFDGANGNLKKEYIYGASGLVATIEPTAINANGTRYTTSDHLGSPRVVTNSSAGVVSRHDYMPFGEELFNGGRTPGIGYGVIDGLRQKFTQKERDNETGLDYFGARYYASAQGRFTSPDPLQASAKRRNPQTWNRYTYGLNNPLRFTDPEGEEPEDVYLRTKIKTTEVTVQERGGGQIVREAKITVTESQTDYVNAQGDVIQSDPTQTSATAVNTGNGVLNYSLEQTKTMANAAQNIVEVSREKGFDATIALGIAQTETHMTTLLSQETSPAKKTNINPMQLSGTSGIKPTTDLRSNIAGAIDVYNRGAGSGLNASLQLYNNEAGRAAYARTAEGHINQIRGSVQTRTVTNNLNQRPARLGFPTRPQ